MFNRFYHWGQASPWLVGANPRDNIMPIDGDDGFFPTTGNELVSLRTYYKSLMSELYSESQICILT